MRWIEKGGLRPIMVSMSDKRLDSPDETRRLQRTILVATTNPGKIVELRAMLDADVEWVGLSDFPQAPEVEEDGRTFAENARKKATTYALATGLWTLSDDSGLVVDALGGQPGVRSARFAGMDGPDRRAIDRHNIEKVLQLLRDVPPDKRTARFVCHLCLAGPEQILIETSGILEGRILDHPLGDKGFGYDPIFWIPSLNKTVAQLESEGKNALSHRGNALRRLKPMLRELLGS
jgi:XTP/dITP diphosphohydrolase